MAPHILPVMWRDRMDARKSTVSATSSALPGLPPDCAGVIEARIAHIGQCAGWLITGLSVNCEGGAFAYQRDHPFLVLDGNLDLIDVAGLHPVLDVRRYLARADHIHTDVVLRQLQRRHLGCPGRGARDIAAESACATKGKAYKRAYLDTRSRRC